MKMTSRRFFVVLAAMLMVGACAPQERIQLGPDGNPLPRVYRITPDMSDDIYFRFLDSTNVLRNAKGATPLAYNSSLNAAAETHSRDMSVQNRPWHFGSDGSSPLSRVQRAGYHGSLKGENIAETYQSEMETLATWMKSQDQRDVILDPAARDLGLGWFQEPNGKIWWTMITGG